MLYSSRYLVWISFLWIKFASEVTEGHQQCHCVCVCGRSLPWWLCPYQCHCVCVCGRSLPWWLCPCLASVQCHCVCVCGRSLPWWLCPYLASVTVSACVVDHFHGDYVPVLHQQCHCVCVCGRSLPWWLCPYLASVTVSACVVDHFHGDYVPILHLFWDMATSANYKFLLSPHVFCAPSGLIFGVRKP